MRNHITPQQVTTYQDNGFVVIDDFLDASELETWRRVTDEAVAERLDAGRREEQAARLMERGNWSNQNDTESYYARVFTQCIKLADTHAGMRELMHDPRLGRAAADLARVDGIRIWHDQALIKPPFGNPTAWHLDNPYWSFSSRDAISLWVALDDATCHNGCLYYLPGTHKEARWDNVGIGANLADLFRAYPQWLEIEPVGSPCRAGSAVFHNGLVAHGAGANMTNRPRRAMTCAYMPVGSTFNGQPNVLPKPYLAGLTVGDVLEDGDANPLLFQRD